MYYNMKIDSMVRNKQITAFYSAQWSDSIIVASDKITAFHNALTPWHRVLKKLIVAFMFKKWNQNVDYHVQKRILPLNHILSHFGPVHTHILFI